MWAIVILLIAMVISVITDLKERKIYNAVLFPALGAAFVGHLIDGGWHGLAASLGGFGVGLGLLLIPYLMGGIGAGDVKLLALVGALQGPAFAFSTAVYMGLIGMGMALIALAAQRRLLPFLKPIVYTVYAWRYGLRLPIPRGSGAGAISMPYGVAIAGGCLFAWLVREVAFQ